MFQLWGIKKIQNQQIEADNAQNTHRNNSDQVSDDEDVGLPDDDVNEDGMCDE